MLNVANCVISGGEPFLRRDLVQIIDALMSNRIFLSSIFTNGTITNKEVTDRLSLMGTTLLVSVDGIGQDHEAIRGTRTFDKTIAFIKQAVSDNVKVMVNTVVTAFNVNKLMELRGFIKDLGVYGWRITVIRPQGNAVSSQEEITPETLTVHSAYRELIANQLENPDGLKIFVNSIFTSNMQRAGLYYLFGDSTSCCEYKRNALVVKPNGDVTPCTAFSDLVFGNVTEQPISDIWRRPETQAFKQLSVGQTDCKTCDIRGLCGAGCRKIAQDLNGSVLAKDDSACSLYRFAFDTICPLLKKHGIKSRSIITG